MQPGSAPSILDKILSSQHAEALEHVSPGEIVTQLLRELTQKETDVIRRRFGLDGKPPETLEQIGKTYQVTRERIRQIERLALRRLKTGARAKTLLQPVTVAVTQVLESHGGFMEHVSFVRTLLQIAGDSDSNRVGIEFLLREILTDHVEPIPASHAFRSGWRLRRSPLGDLQSVIAAIKHFFEQTAKPLPQATFLTEARAAMNGDTVSAKTASDEALLAAVDLSTELDHNPFGEYGLARWSRVHPRRMNDKILLVLERAGQPLHFTDIATHINDAGFDDRVAYAPTVHNELILDDQYVLVGRGIYALQRWGYQPGVVAEVIRDVLQAAEHPLTRAQIDAEVLKRRFVKRNTIHLALTNRQRFERLTDGTYRVAEAAADHPSHGTGD